LCILLLGQDKYLVRNIKPPNNQSCFPNFFPQNSQFEQLKRKETYHWPKTEKKTVLAVEKICFLFQLLKLKKIGEIKIGCLVI
jgi:hypothetical protein